MLAALGGQLCIDNFGVNLVCNSNLALINSGVIFKVKQDLTSTSLRGRIAQENI